MMRMAAPQTLSKSVMEHAKPAATRARRLPVHTPAFPVQAFGGENFVRPPCAATPLNVSEERVKTRIAETSADMFVLAAELARLLALTTGSAVYKDLVHSAAARPLMPLPAQTAATTAQPMTDITGTRQSESAAAPPQCLGNPDHDSETKTWASDVSTQDASEASDSCDIGDVAESRRPLLQSTAQVADVTPNTTLMIRNVPVMYTQTELVEEWPNEGTYDFLYLPRAGDTNLSYAFVNFVSTEAAEEFKAKWHKQRLARHTSRKPLNISFAEVQGLAANVRELRKKRTSRMRARNCEPIIVLGGRSVCYAEAMDALAEGAGKAKNPITEISATLSAPCAVSEHAMGAPFGPAPTAGLSCTVFRPPPGLSAPGTV